MSAIGVEEYVLKHFVKALQIKVISDVDTLVKEYPLFAAVNRAANVVSRHQGRIIFLEYKPPQPAKKSLLLVGKGVTYDTGGADIKISGGMIGMSRDKCGAAAVAGFMQVSEPLVHFADKVHKNSVLTQYYFLRLLFRCFYEI